MRGKVIELTLPLPFCGITPAYAGKSFVLLDPMRRMQDHPRVCGEKTKKIP